MKKSIFAALALMMFAAAFVYADPIQDWADFESSLRKGQISGAEAEFEAKKLTKNLDNFVSDKGITEDSQWEFPISSFTKSDVANIKKFYSELVTNASEPKFFEGEQFLGQKYLLIEVSSKNASAALDVIAVNNGIVIYEKRGALNSTSGNCVWLYNPAQHFYIFYGFLRDVSVKQGDIVKTGDKIGTIRPSKKGYELKFTVLMYGDDKFGIYPYFDDMK